MTTLAPPPVGSGYTTVLNGHFAIGGNRVAFPGVNFDASCIWGIGNPGPNGLVIDPNQQKVYAAELDRLLSLGVRFIRVLGIDCVNINPIFLWDAKAKAFDTTKFDTGKAAALKWFLSQCSQRGIYYLIPLHYKRYLTLADLGPNPSPLALECVANSWEQGPPGQTPPWDLFDKQTLKPLVMQCDTQIAELIGDDQAFVGYDLENENPVVKANIWDFNSTRTPQIYAANHAAWPAWLTAGGNPNGLTGRALVNKYWADLETSFAAARIANLKKIQSHALFTVNTFYGDGSFATLASSLAVGDFISGHVYTGGPVTDGPGFYVGQPGANPPDARSRFSTVCGCCKWIKPSTNQEMPTVISEYGPQFQCAGNPFDSEPWLAGDMMAAAWQMAKADVDAATVYSWNIWPIWAGGVSERGGPYQLRDCPEVCEAMAAANSVFLNPAYRPTTETVVKPTGGLYGSSSPINEPAVRALPTGTKAVMSV
jgi:hypothetical protein